MTESKNSWWDQWVRERRLFILGAGFSAAAEIPMTGPLLARAMRAFQVECPTLYDVFEGSVLTCFGLDADPSYEQLNLSDLCTFLHYRELREYGGGERWANAGSRENLALKYYIAKEIVRSTPQGGDIPDLYLRFARQLTGGDLVITFNWDCLLEAALDQIDKEYSYKFEEDKIKIVKLHGSIAWRLGRPRKCSLKWSSLELYPDSNDLQVYESRDVQCLATWANGMPLGEIEPFLVLPGFGKGFDVRRLATLWYKPEFAFAFTYDIYVIGLSLSSDDFIVRSLLLDNMPSVDKDAEVQGRRIRIINPDPSTRANYDFIVGTKRVDFICEPLGLAHIGMIEEGST